MSHYLLSAETTFSAAHTLPGVETCDRFHGHNWRVRLTVRIEEASLGSGAMALDFRELERITQDVVRGFDHSYLNDLEPFRQRPPTAERIANVIGDRAIEELGRTAPAALVEQVEVWELPQYRVTYRPG